MPLTVRCRECGHILYEGPFKGTDVILSDIRKSNYGRAKCPSCERRLTIRGGTVMISPAEGVKP